MPTKFGLQLPEMSPEVEKESLVSHSFAVFSDDSKANPQPKRKHVPDEATMQKKKENPTMYTKQPTKFGL